jgi:hypothetical protein
MDHPEKVMFVDETGTNTNQGKDGNIGGIKFLPQGRSAKGTS